MGTEIQLWLKEYADSLVHDGELITWVAGTKAHVERCRETGEDPFPDAVSIEELKARIEALKNDGDSPGSMEP